ncbi:MAG: HEAT repeat domain-containing protein [Planctomycetota bacterium]
MKTIASVLIVLGLVSSPLWAHGGQYKGPADAAGASSGSGGNAGPPTNPAGASSPAPGATTGGAATGTGAPTGGKGARGDTGKGASQTGTSQTDLEENFEIWEYWWENNKDQYLNLKNRLVSTSSQTGSSGLLSGRGRKDAGKSTRRPSDELIANEVIPTLTSIMSATDKGDIIDSAVLAMARSSRPTSHDAVLAVALPLISHKELSVQTSATLSLGVLGSAKAIKPLRDLMADTGEGRKLTGGNVPWLVRAFAALSLGLINDPSSTSALMDIVANLPDSDRDIKVCAIVGLGLMDNAQSAEASKFLVKMLGDAKLDSITKSYVPTSLAKLNSRLDNPDPSVLPALLQTFNDRDTDDSVRQSAAIGLGLLGHVTHEEVMKALLDYISAGKDIQTRHFCFISLAQIGDRDTSPQEHVEVHERIKKLLLKEVSKPDAKSNRSWAALASAIYAKGRESEGTFLAEISAAYEKEKDPSFKAAFALALGLLNAQHMGGQIFEDFQGSRDYDFKGYASVALGFMNHSAAADTLREVCKNKTITPNYRLQVATALGLMGDTEAVDTLVSTLEDAQTLGVSSAVAKALGLIGDVQAIEPLKAIAFDTTKPILTRAFACVALGIVCEKSDLPWNAAISQDNNYRAGVPAIDEVLDIL